VGIESRKTAALAAGRCARGLLGGAGRCPAGVPRAPRGCAHPLSREPRCTVLAIRAPPGELLASYRGHTHTGVKMGCALMPGDAFVVGASEDGAPARLLKRRRARAAARRGTPPPRAAPLRARLPARWEGLCGDATPAAAATTRRRQLRRPSPALLSSNVQKTINLQKFTVSRSHTARARAGRLLYWELVDATLVLSFQAHRGAVCGVAAHPKGACVLTAGADGLVKVWGR
jgi:hypothetical protein